MNRFALTLALPCLFPASVLADDFTGFSMDFVDVGNAGNEPDNTGYGAVGYDYRISKYEVSVAMIDSYNALSGGPMITKDTRDANEPATNVSWNEAARFVNWLNTSNGHSAAYNFTTDGRDENITLWTGADAGYDPANPFRNSNAYYFLPSEDEWYKAAYYSPNANDGAGGYFDYATGSDTAPTPVARFTDEGTAVWNQGFFDVAPVDSAGGLSPYGTMAQNGNVWEWCESAVTGSNDNASESRVLRGGAFWDHRFAWLDPISLSSGYSDGYHPAPDYDPDQAPIGDLGNRTIGFRVASVPEPSGALLTVLGAMGLMLKRRRP